VRAIKEAVTRVGRNASDLADARARGESRRYVLPDGSSVELPEHVGLALGETLFAPSRAGREDAGLTETIQTAISTHPDLHVRRLLHENVFVFGGGSGVAGLRERLAQDARTVGPASVSGDPVAWPDYLPRGGQAHAAFHGGAILAKAMAAQQSQAQGKDPGGVGGQDEKRLWVTKADYNEHGPLCARIKC